MRSAVAKPSRVLAYVRVSGQEQGRTGTSLDGQRAEIERYCAAHGYPDPIVRVEVESAGAEKIERRAVLRALLTDAVAGDLVAVAKVDRWSRDIVFAVQSVRELVARGVGWISIGEGIDARTSAGDSTLGIMSWVADFERVRIRERTVMRRRALRDQGLYVEGLPPVGYRRGTGNVLEVVEVDAAIVRDVYARCIAGEPIGRIQVALRKQHPTRHGWDKKCLHTMLRSRTYLGEVRTTQGAWIPAHPAIVDRRTWDTAAAALASRRLTGPVPGTIARTHRWLLRGLATCAQCGARMAASYGGPHRGYYMCSRHCGARLVPVPVVDPAVGEAVLMRLMELREALSSGDRGHALRTVHDYDARREKLATRRTRTIDLAVDGTLSREDLQRRLAAIDRDLARVDADEAAHAREQAAQRPTVRAGMLRELGAMATSWAHLDVPERRDCVAHLASAIAIARDETPRITWRTIAELAE